MTGPKLNEATRVAGERSGTKATARYLRSSAYKAREVLDHIRGRDVRAADELLQLLERDVARDIRKVLASAVANAQNNDELDPDDLYVKACFADEGPTLKRFRPRARGRASRIRKRTTHVTIVVAPLTEEMTARRAAKEAARPSSGRRVPSSAAAARRARVERSRAAAAARAAATETTAEEAGDDVVDAQMTADAVVGAPYGEGSHAPLPDGSQPDGFPIKGNADSMLYHTPSSRHYAQTVAEVWFATEAAAEEAGFSKPPSQRDDDEADGQAAEGEDS